MRATLSQLCAYPSKAVRSTRPKRNWLVRRRVASIADRSDPADGKSSVTKCKFSKDELGAPMTASTLNPPLTERTVTRSGRKKVWIDLENSPHVPFFRPIIDELEARGYSVTLTARDCFQVVELADMVKLRYKKVGRHYGKNSFAKVLGLCIRCAQMMPGVLKEKPDL